MTSTTTVSGLLPVVAAAGIIAVACVLGLLVQRIALVRLSRFAKKTPWRIDDVLVASLKYPLPIWFVSAGVYFGMRTARVPRWLAPIIDRTLMSILIVSITFWIADFLARLLRLGGAKATSATGVVRNVARVAVIAIGGLVLLNTLGISFVPVVTTVGLGGLAVALGLQKTVANFFAGLEITLEGNLHVGDFVRLESGEEGYVDDIHWRTTRVRTLFNQSVLIPNSQLSDSVVANYHLPSESFDFLVGCGVHPKSNLEHVERVTVDVARTIMKSVRGGDPEFEPFVRFNRFGESTIDFNVILRARQFTDQFLLRHEFIKALTAAFAREGIVMPPPIRSITLRPDAREAVQALTP